MVSCRALRVTTIAASASRPASRSRHADDRPGPAEAAATRDHHALAGGEPREHVIEHHAQSLAVARHVHVADREPDEVDAGRLHDLGDPS